MFSKVLAFSSLFLALSLQVHAHAIIAPPLGVSGTPVRNDVQQPSAKAPCGTINIASTLDTSTPVQAAADGTFTVTVTDFNAGTDGSRSVTATVDPTGKGTSFVAADITTNGNANPTTVGSDTVVASLPAGTVCSGGTAGNRCLVAFETTAKFGNCVVVEQAAGAAATTDAIATTATTTHATTTVTHETTTATHETTTATHATAAATTDATTGASDTPATTASATATTAVKHHHHKGAGKAAKSAACSTDTAAAKAGKNAARRAAVKRAYGTRAARAARLAA